MPCVAQSPAWHGTCNCDLMMNTLGIVIGVIVAVAIMAGAWWFVTRARKGNQRVREARHDPHAEPHAKHDSDHDRRRDIPQ
jgi:hypothetical protein